MKNRGNFLTLLDLIAKCDNELKNHLAYGTRNQKYTSKTTQNELINIVGEYLREELLVPLQISTYYSIMADEVTDNHANWEILSLCLRFLDLRQKPTIKEVFFGFPTS